MVREKDLYEPVRKLLEDRFREKGDRYVEASPRGIAEGIKKHLDDDLLYFLKVEKIFPDIIGWYTVENGTHKLMVAEVKAENLKIKDIYQIKMYAELFRAAYAFLISAKPLPEEIRRYLKSHPEILSHSAGFKRITIAQFDSEKNEILEQS